MEQGRGALAFVGPKGSGKSTTFKKACFASQDGKLVLYIDVYDFHRKFTVIPPNLRDTYCFVDNAQLLHRDRESFSVLTSLRKAFKTCLAFSPEVMTKSGASLLNCPIPIYGKMFYFTPFTSHELRRYTELRGNKESTLPSIVTLVMNGNDYVLSLSRYIHHSLQKALSYLQSHAASIECRNAKSFFDALLQSVVYTTF